MYGEEGLKNGGQPQQQTGSIFDLFGGGMGMGGPRGARKSPTISANMDVTLEELYNGAKKVFRINRRVICPKCSGTGAEGGATQRCPGMLCCFVICCMRTVN